MRQLRCSLQSMCLKKRLLIPELQLIACMAIAAWRPRHPTLHLNRRRVRHKVSFEAQFCRVYNTQCLQMSSSILDACELYLEVGIFFNKYKQLHDLTLEHFKVERMNHFLTLTAWSSFRRCSLLASRVWNVQLRSNLSQTQWTSPAASSIVHMITEEACMVQDPQSANRFTQVMRRTTAMESLEC